MTEDKAIWDQLLELKALTQSIGVVHEAQVQQLKFWAFCIFGHIPEIRIQVEPKAIIEFVMEKCPADENMITNLDLSIKDMMGDYFTVKITMKKDDGSEKTTHECPGARRKKRIGKYDNA